MARLPKYKRIYKTDYSEEYQELIEKLSFPINIGIELLYDALNNKLTREDNLLSNVIEFVVTVDSQGIPTSPTSFNISSKITRAGGIVVEKADNLTNTNTFPTGGIFISWSQSRQSIIINHITGLPADNSFQLRVAVYG